MTRQTLAQPTSIEDYAKTPKPLFPLNSDLEKIQFLKSGLDEVVCPVSSAYFFDNVAELTSISRSSCNA